MRRSFEARARAATSSRRATGAEKPPGCLSESSPRARSSRRSARHNAPSRARRASLSVRRSRHRQARHRPRAQRGARDRAPRRRALARRRRPAPPRAPPLASPRAAPLPAARLRAAARAARPARRAVSLAVRAADEASSETAEAPAAEAAAEPVSLAPVPETFSKICDFEDLPRGDRRKVDALGKSILLFWYKDTVCCIESRSPAEGAFSEGFANARLTQDGCIVCPGTQSTFDLRTGEIKSWYPDNAVLRRLTPIETCRPMEVFPVLVRPDGIFVDVKNGSLGPDFRAATTSGGSDTSLENNNVYAVEPRMYVQGEDGRCARRRQGRRDVEDDPGTPRYDRGGRRGCAGRERGVRLHDYVAPARSGSSGSRSPRRRASR